MIAGSGRDLVKDVRQIETGRDVGESKVVHSRQRICMTWTIQTPNEQGAASIQHHAAKLNSISTD